MTKKLPTIPSLSGIWGSHQIVRRMTWMKNEPATRLREKNEDLKIVYRRDLHFEKGDIFF